MNIDVAQALYMIKRLPGEELPNIAVDLLVHGVDTAAVRELAGLQGPTLRDAGALFERVLTELGRPSMTIEQAAQVIARDLARRVLAGELQPRDAANRGWSFCPEAGYPDVLTRFLAYADDYECYPDQSASIDAEVIDYAKHLLASERGEAV
jgi:hypothetical protein